MASESQALDSNSNTANAHPDQPKTIDAPPRANQSIQYRNSLYTTIKEGLAYVLVPDGVSTSTDPRLPKECVQRQSVFYNPIQQFNRDLSVVAIRTFGDDLVTSRKTKGVKQARKHRARQKRRVANGQDEDAQKGEDGADSPDAPSKRRKTHDSDETCAAHVAESLEEDNIATKSLPPAQILGSEVLRKEESRNGALSKPDSNIPFKILDALSATGLRALRYAQEIPFVTSIVANDMSQKATESITMNIEHNNLGDTIKANVGNAIAYMYSFVGQKGFDVIDLDPYGTAVPFLDAAVQALNDGGLLCITCTDSAIFASHGYLEKTYSQYGGLPLKGEASHEGGIRLILHAIATTAGRYGVAIEPLLSLSIDYYIRVFVRIRKSPNEVKLLASKTMIVYNCDSGCGSTTTQFLARHSERQGKDGTPFYKHSYAQGPSVGELCPHCNFKTHVTGPMYGGPIHNPAFVERMLAHVQNIDTDTYATKDRMEGMLHTAHDEITYAVNSQKSSEAKVLDPTIPPLDAAEMERHPFYFTPSNISRVLHCQAPPAAAIRGALRHAGFQVTMSHCKAGSIRTDAKWSDIWHIMREWVRQKAPLVNKLKEGSAGKCILEKGVIDPSIFQQKRTDRTEAVEAGASLNETVKDDDRTSYLGSSFDVVFDDKLGKDPDKGKYVRYQLAPRENWGPMTRAKGGS